MQYAAPKRLSTRALLGHSGAMPGPLGEATDLGTAGNERSSQRCGGGNAVAADTVWIRPAVTPRSGKGVEPHAPCYIVHYAILVSGQSRSASKLPEDTASPRCEPGDNRCSQSAIPRVMARTGAVRRGHPRDTAVRGSVSVNLRDFPCPKASVESAGSATIFCDVHGDATWYIGNASNHVDRPSILAPQKTCPRNH